MAVSRVELIRQLEELVEAIDRRLPHVERAGEAAIVREAAALRTVAMRRLAELAKAADGDASEPPLSAPRRAEPSN